MCWKYLDFQALQLGRACLIVIYDPSKYNSISNKLKEARIFVTTTISEIKHMHLQRNDSVREWLVKLRRAEPTLLNAEPVNQARQIAINKTAWKAHAGSPANSQRPVAVKKTPS